MGQGDRFVSKTFPSMRTKTLIVRLALVLAASSTTWQTHAEPPKAAEDVEKGRAAFADLRKMALTKPRAELGIPAANATSPWGVIMETGMEGGSYTLVMFSDGSTSLYFSNGGGIIGGGGQEAVSKASQAVVTLAASFQPKAAITKEFPLPKNGETTFYLRTDAGVFTMTAPEQDLGEKRHAWAPLFHAAHGVITQLRLVEERK